MTSLYRPEFEAALRLLARMSEEMASQGYSRPVLVGGAAVEYWSGSAISTGDFDLCTPRQQAFEAILQRHGFVRPSGPGKATRGWIHPDLALGFEIVASVPMDGSVDRDHILLLEDFSADGDFAIIAVEDLIADRLGNTPRAAHPTCSARPASCYAFTRAPTWPILIAASARKQVAIMASKASQTDPDAGLRRVSHRALAERLAARRAELGNPELPRNAGKNRTASKRALLKAIEDAGGKW
jgi:hypothetical protein